MVIRLPGCLSSSDSDDDAVREEIHIRCNHILAFPTLIYRRNTISSDFDPVELEMRTRSSVINVWGEI